MHLLTRLMCAASWLLWMVHYRVPWLRLPIWSVLATPIQHHLYVFWHAAFHLSTNIAQDCPMVILHLPPTSMSCTYLLVGKANNTCPGLEYDPCVCTNRSQPH